MRRCEPHALALARSRAGPMVHCCRAGGQALCPGGTAAGQSAGVRRAPRRPLLTRFVRVEVLWPRNVLGNLLLAVPRVLGQQPHLRGERDRAQAETPCRGWQAARAERQSDGQLVAARTRTPALPLSAWLRARAVPTTTPSRRRAVNAGAACSRKAVAPLSATWQRCHSPPQRLSCAARCGKCQCQTPAGRERGAGGVATCRGRAPLCC